MRKVMIFGIFEELHEKHRALFEEARQYGDHIIAVVAQDHIAEHLKGSLPALNFADRFVHLEEADAVDEVVIGAPEMSITNLVRRYRPDVVAFTKGQDALKNDLESQVKNLGYKPKIQMLKNAEPKNTHEK